MTKHLLWIGGLYLSLAACGIQPENKFWIARAASSNGSAWQAFYDAAWHDVVIEGVRPPSYVRPHILTADNLYMFAGQLDTAGRKRTDLPTFHLAAWNVYPPVRRRIADGETPDTTGLRWLTEDDFPSVVEYQRFSLLAASVGWPWTGKGVEFPDSTQRWRDAP